MDIEGGNNDNLVNQQPNIGFETSTQVKTAIKQTELPELWIENNKMYIFDKNIYIKKNQTNKRIINEDAQIQLSNKKVQSKPAYNAQSDTINSQINTLNNL